MLGWEGNSGGPASGYVELRFLEDEDEELDLGEFNMGIRTRPARRGPLGLRGQVDIGLVRADLDRLQNDNTLISLGFGVQPVLRLNEAVSIVGLLGYRFYFDTTEPTTCNDGTTSTSTGSGTCSSHGGIDHLNDKIGDGGGGEVALGIRTSF